MSLKKIIGFIVKLPFKVLKAVFIILGACKKRNKTV